MRLHTRAILVAIMVAMTMMSVAPNAMAKVYTMKFASPGGMALVIGKFGKWFCDEVAKRTDGKIKTQYYHSGQMGGTMELAEKLQAGILQGALMSASHASNFNPTIGVLNLPFLFDDYNKADKMLSSPLMKPIYGGLKDMGITGVDTVEFGFYSVATSKPVKTFEELQNAGFKSRASDSKMHIDIHRALGMRPTPIPFPEVYSSLQQGVIDALDTSPEMIKLLKFNEVINNIVLTKHFYGAEIIWFNTKWLNSLPPELRKIVIDTAKEGAVIYRKESRDIERKILADLPSSGVTVVILEQGEMEKFRKAADKVHKKYGDQIGREYLQKVYDLEGYGK